MHPGHPELSRWGRSTIDPVQTLQAWDVPVLAVSGPPFDLSTPHGKMIASVMAALAEFERDFIRERIKSGIAAAKARGKRSTANHDGVHRTARRQRPSSGGGWSELPVDRAAMSGSAKPPTEQSRDASDTHSGRVSAARGARDEHSTLARHGFLVSE
jgi:hypothetical protein